MELKQALFVVGLVSVMGLGATETARAQSSGDHPSSAPGASASPGAATVTTPGTPSEANKRQARERFQRGVDLYDEGDFAAALIEFKKAYDLAPTYKLQYKIGQVSYRLKDYAGALMAFKLYLRQGGDKISPKRRAEVEEELRILRSQVGYLDIHCNEPGASVSIDDKPVGKTPLAHPILVSMGKRKITLTKDGRAPVTREVDVAGEETEVVDIELVKIEGRKQTIIRTIRPKSRMTGWSWAGLVVSGALAAGAGLTGVLATNASNDLSNMTYAGPNPSSELQDQQSKTRHLALATDILAGASIVTLTTTLVWTFTRPEHPDDRAPNPKKGPKQARAFVSPTIGFGSVGLKGNF